MRITEITLGDFKGVAERVSIGQYTLIVGPNGTGKTARLLAPTWAITGSTALGKRPEDSVPLAGILGCHVEVATDGGFTWLRCLKIAPKTGKVTSDVQVHGQESLGVRDADALITQTVGNFAPMFDIRAFLNLSADKQRDFVLSLSAGGAGNELDAGRLLDRIRLEWLKGRLGEATVEVVCGNMREASSGDHEAIVALLSQVGEYERNACHTACADIGPELTGDLTTAIAAALDKVKLLTNASKRATDEARAAGRKLSDQKAGITVVAASVEELKQDEAKLRAQKEEVVGQIENQAGRKAARESLVDSLDRARSSLNNQKLFLSGVRKAEGPGLPEAEALEQQAAEIEIAEVDVEAARVASDEARTAFQDAIQALNDAQAEHKTVLQEAQSLEAPIRRLAESPWRKAVDLLDEYEQACSFDQPDPWHQLVEFVKSQSPEKELAKLQQELRKLTQSRPKIASRIVAKHEDAEAKRQASDEAQDAYAKAIDAKTTADAAIESRDDLLRKAADFRNRAANHEDKIKRIEERVAELQHEVTVAERALNDFDAERGHIPTDDLEHQRDAIETQLFDLTEKLAQRERFQTLERELTDCLARAEQEQVMHEVCKGLGKAVRAVRETIMADLVKPLLSRIDDGLSVMMRDRKAYCDLVTPSGKPKFELGWIADGERKVALSAMSGGETVIYCTCLIYGLTMLADPPLKLLLIEAAELDSSKLSAMLMGIGKLPGLSNAMVASCNYPLAAPTDPDWKVISTQDACVPVEC